MFTFVPHLYLTLCIIYYKLFSLSRPQQSSNAYSGTNKSPAKWKKKNDPQMS